jgi:hypothetical protein
MFNNELVVKSNELVAQNDKLVVKSNELVAQNNKFNS